jgi:hypothetical protein
MTYLRGSTYAVFCIPLRECQASNELSILTPAIQVTIEVSNVNRIVEHIAVQVETLRVVELGVRHQLGRSRPVGRGPSPLRPREVPRAKVIPPRLRVPFLAGNAP